MRPFWRFVRTFALACVLIVPGSARSEPVLGDSDQDGDRDLAEVARLLNCQAVSLAPGHSECDAFRFSSDNAVDSLDLALFACAFQGPGGAIISIAADAPPSPTAALGVHLSGTTAGAHSVRITGGAQVVTVPTDGCDFDADVQLLPNVVNHLYLSAIFGDGKLSAPFPVTVAHDAQPPTLFVDFPSAGSQITTDKTDVAGRVGDALSGFAGMTVEVAVNDQPPVAAIVDIGVGSNGTYFLRQLPLGLGANTLKVTARDALGNSVQQQIAVTRIEVPTNAAQMVVLSGDAQSAPVHGVLPAPIQVRVSSVKGIPLVGKLVTFNVVRSDGRLASNASGVFPGAKTIQIFTDSQGIARAFWRLGGDAGRGNNRVEVTSETVVGTTAFCASATPGPASQINVSKGNNQRVVVDSQAPDKLGVWVNDSCNPRAGVDVTFTVLQGGGKVDGQDAITIETSLSGHAEVGFRLGAAAGNNVIEANFPGNPNAPAVFTISGIARNESAPTTFSGLVLDNGGQPIQGATCALVIEGNTLPFVLSDLNGQFRFDAIQGSGPADVHVFGASATHVGGATGIDIPPNTYPALRYNAIIVPNANNSLPTPVLLPRLNPANARFYSTTQDTELTTEGMAGLKMIVKAGSMKIRIGSQLVAAPNGTVLSLNQVHHDDVPMPLPDGAAPPFAWTLQPGGAQFDPPVTIFYPNMSGLPAGAIANFLSFNHATGKFEIIASGHVSDDGTTIVTDPGAGISIAGWGCNCPPYSVTGQCCHCNACQECKAGLCFPAGIPCGETCCTDGQTCCEGTCIPADSVCCDGGSVCSSDETCCHGSCCLEGEECCENGCCRADEQCCGDRCISALNICCDNGTECFPPEFPQCCGSSCCVADAVCCDDECQIPGSTCCSPGHVCSPPTPHCCGESCCAEGAQCCNDVCAPPGTTCCDQPGFCPADKPQCCVETCCASDQLCCNGACAPAGSTCCSDGHVCEADQPQCCGSTCCPSDGVCCNGLCLPAGNVCCEDGVICDVDAPVCCHGDCCLTTDICCADGCHPVGTTCCGTGSCSPPNPQCCGQTCCGETDHCCGNGTCCEAELVCCGDAGCCGSDEICCNGQCLTPGSNCCLNGFCTAPNSQCCGDTCCAPADVCCPNGNCCEAGTTCCGEDGCCSADETCCNGQCVPPGGNCCPEGACTAPNTQCCGHTCCGANDDCCENGTCCEAGTTCCGDKGCCAANQVCCNGECLPPGGNCCPNGSCSPPNSQCCGDSCCAPNDVCCSNSTCCEAGTTCCGNDGCCQSDEVCCDGACKPAGTACCSDGRSFCGDVCCPANFTCCNGTCSPGSICCSDGRPFCGSVCCTTGTVCCNGSCSPGSFCCSDGRPFCGDACCNAGSLCCNGLCAPVGQACP